MKSYTIRDLRTAAAFTVLWLGVSYVFAMLLAPAWIVANMIMR